MMTTRHFALVFGVIFLLVGIAGFIPGLTQMPHAQHPPLQVDAYYGLLFGLFPVNILHNAVHMLFGVWGLAAYFGFGGARLYARGVAIIYALATIAGFVPGLDTGFGLVPLFSNDIWLHALLALAGAYSGWVHRDRPADTIIPAT
jgi:hypothetical protein